MKNKHITLISISITVFIGIFLLITFIIQKKNIQFDGKRAYEDIIYQMNLGPRTIGSLAHDQVGSWIETELQQSSWDASIQEFSYGDQAIRNIIGKRGNGRPWIILGAHYDSRFLADHDPNKENQSSPVPGANDGASGVAVLLELARIIPRDINKQIWLVFFDAEDNGNIPGWDWILGSQEFASTLQDKPDAVVVVDMIGDKDLNIYKEKNSNQTLMNEIWEQANRAGYSQFHSEFKYRVLDDHIPFVRLDIPAVDIIDLDYPYYHTIEDTADKVSAESLEAVGQTLLQWLIK